jgi:hypothetical protein
MKLEDKIKVVKQVLNEKNVDHKEFLIWLSEGINASIDWSKKSIDELIKINIDFDESESEEEYTNEEDLIEVISMWVGEVGGNGFLGDGTL